MRVRARLAWLPVGSFLALAVGCGALPTAPHAPRVCTALYAYGVTLTVGAEDGSSPTNVACVLTDPGDPGFTEVMTRPFSSTWLGAGERPGNYRLEISGDGWTTWSTNFRLESDGCHVAGISIAATLAPR